MEYTTVGDTTNTAARLEAMTKGTPNQLFLAESTKEALSNADGLAFVDEMPVRGRTTGIRIWSLAGDETDESGARPATRPESEPVGGSPAPGAGAAS
jgi:class 3 adenylate cyclase